MFLRKEIHCLSSEPLRIVNIGNNSNLRVDILRVFIFIFFSYLTLIKKTPNNPITYFHNHCLMNKHSGCSRILSILFILNNRQYIPSFMVVLFF